MNILFIIPNLEIGGAQSFLLRLASAMTEEQHSIILYNIHPKQVNHSFYESLLSSSVTLYHSKAESIEQKIENYSLPSIVHLIKKVVFKIKSRRKHNENQLIQIIKKHKIEVINSHMYLADLFICQYKDIIPKSTIWISSFHGCYNLLLGNHSSDIKLKEQLKNIITKTNGTILAADRHFSVFDKLDIIDFNAQKIYYGFVTSNYKKRNLKAIYKISADAFVFGMIARGDQTKGWLEAIESFIKLPAESNAYLVLIGDGTYLENLSEEYKSHKNIIFTGPTDQPLREIESFNVCLLPTYYPAESLPNSIIEYLYCHKPIIATSWAEIPKMLSSETGIAGQLISIDTNGKANIEELRKAMEKCVNNPELLKQYSINAGNAFMKFNMKSCIANYLDFFNKAVKCKVIL
jgi:glycosyltransferase involved in cell wall biosynthesis